MMYYLKITPDHMQNEIRPNFIVYHYTDFNALIQILRKDDIRLRATNCMYLNDSKEIKEGNEAIQRYCHKMISESCFDNYYITSFSQNKDSLPMWGRYAANGEGCAIGLNTDELLSKFSFMAQCVYGTTDIDRQLKSMMESCASSKNLELISLIKELSLISICLSAKNQAFRDENEFRFILENHNNKDIHFKIKKGIIVPFINVSVSKTALREIIIGPTNNSQLTKQSLYNFL